MLYDLEQAHKTVRDLAALPDDGKQYELIAGEIIMVPPPSTYHQDIAGDLFEKLRAIVRSKQLGKVFFSPVNVYADGENVYQPDILFIRRDNLQIIEMDGIHGAPDFVIEILSPSNAYYDLKTKKDAYQYIGVHEYWIVDPMDHSIECFINSKKGYTTFFLGKNGNIQSQIIPEFAVDVQSVFQL